MNKYKKSIIVFLLLLEVQFVLGQNQSNSPYTRYGYGELSNSTSVEMQGMGGVSIANRSNHIINGMNPASYSSVDSLTFMFDIAVNTRISRFYDNKKSNGTLNSNLQYIRMRFPLAKWIAFGAGLEPYSYVGYKYQQSDSAIMSFQNGMSENIFYTKYYQGTGGLSQVYAGTSVKLFNHLALGVNAYYLFGELSNNRLVSFADDKLKPTSDANKIEANDFRLRYGLQYFHRIGNHNITLGAIYEPKQKLNGKFSNIFQSEEMLTNSDFELPEVIGTGINYTFNHRLTVGVDYLRKDWSNVRYFGRTDTLLRTTNQLAVGFEYIPHLQGRKYVDNIRYRAGFRTSNQYYKVKGQEVGQNYVFSIGAGLPIFTGKSILNIALEYGKIGNSSLLRQDFIQLSFSASINEYWFFKPKL